MPSDLIQRLQRLQCGFSAPCASEADAEALFEEAVAFRCAARSDSGLLTEVADASRCVRWSAVLRAGGGASLLTASLAPRTPCSLVAGLLQQYGPLNRLLSSETAFNAAHMSQFLAACVASHGCACLADRLPPSQNNIFRLASSLELVFGAGLAALRCLRTSLTASSCSGWLELLLVCTHQLTAAANVLQRTAHPLRQPEAAAAFVRTVGRPEAMLPWLAAVTEALLSVPADMDDQVYGRVNDVHTPARGGLLCSTDAPDSWLLEGRLHAQT